jgi:predicted phage tail protein
MIKVTFYKNIQKYSGTSEHYFNVEDFSSLLNGLREIFPKLARLFKEDCIALTYNKGNLIPNSWVLRDIIPEDVKEINLVPQIQGGGGKFGKIALGIALTAFAATAFGGFGGSAGFGLDFGSGIGGLIGKQILGVGINLILSGLLQEELKPPQPLQSSDANQRRNNDIFDGLVNTLATNTPVNLNYGEIRVSGQLISGYVKTINHGRDDIIQVGDYFSNA